ncbi:MAG: hypothetical protein ACI9QN_000775, partial [Arcticibacterium sp.]
KKPMIYPIGITHNVEVPKSLACSSGKPRSIPKFIIVSQTFTSRNMETDNNPF